MGLHTVSCHLTQVNVPRLNPSQTGRYSIYLPRRDGRLSWPWCWLYIETVYLSTQAVTHPICNHLIKSWTHDLAIISPTAYHYTTKSHLFTFQINSADKLCWRLNLLINTAAGNDFCTKIGRWLRRQLEYWRWCSITILYSSYTHVTINVGLCISGQHDHTKLRKDQDIADTQLSGTN